MSGLAVSELVSTSCLARCSVDDPSWHGVAHAMGQDQLLQLWAAEKQLSVALPCPVLLTLQLSFL
jgi:hypothetical protein